MSELKTYEFRDVTVNITMAEYEQMYNYKKEYESLKSRYDRLEERYNIAHEILERIQKLLCNCLFYQDHEWCFNLHNVEI